MTLHASAADLLQHLPGKTTPQSPQGERFIRAFVHGIENFSGEASGQ